MFGGYGVSGGPGGFVSGGGFSGEQSKMMFADMDDEDFDS